MNFIRDPSIQSRLQLDWPLKYLTICKKKKMGWHKSKACSKGEQIQMPDDAGVKHSVEKFCYDIEYKALTYVSRVEFSKAKQHIKPPDKDNHWSTTMAHYFQFYKNNQGI